MSGAVDYPPGQSQLCPLQLPVKTNSVSAETRTIIQDAFLVLKMNLRRPVFSVWSQAYLGGLQFIVTYCHRLLCYLLELNCQNT